LSISPTIDNTINHVRSILKDWSWIMMKILIYYNANIEYLWVVGVLTKVLTVCNQSSICLNNICSVDSKNIRVSCHNEYSLFYTQSVDMSKWIEIEDRTLIPRFLLVAKGDHFSSMDREICIFIPCPHKERPFISFLEATKIYSSS
jgi:hypothetical protein